MSDFRLFCHFIGSMSVQLAERLYLVGDCDVFVEYLVAI